MIVMILSMRYKAILDQSVVYIVHVNVMVWAVVIDVDTRMREVNVTCCVCVYHRTNTCTHEAAIKHDSFPQHSEHMYPYN